MNVTKYIITVGIIKDLCLGISLLFWPVVAGITSAKYIAAPFGPVAGGVVLIVSALCARAALDKRVVGKPIGYVAVYFQQFLLLLSVLGGVEAVWQGQYANGVVLPRAFIFNDQIIYALVAGLHVVTLWTYGRQPNILIAKCENCAI